MRWRTTVPTPAPTTPSAPPRPPTCPRASRHPRTPSPSADHLSRFGVRSATSMLLRPRNGGGGHRDRAHPGHQADRLTVLGEAEQATGVGAVPPRVVVNRQRAVAVRDR